MMLRVYAVLAVLTYVAFSGFVVETIIPGASRFVRLLNVAADAVIILLGLSVAVRTGWNAVRVLFLLFLFGSLLTLIYNHDYIDVLTHSNGLREPLFFFCILLTFHDLLTGWYAEEAERLMCGFLLLFSVAQTPTSLFQFIPHGAGDHVGGTFGWGGSGVVSQSLFLITCFFLVRNTARVSEDAVNLRRLALYCLLLIPVALNETKVSFIYLAGLILVLIDTRRIRMLLPMALAGIGLFALLIEYYTRNVGDPTRILSWEFLDRYLFYSANQGGDIPRFQKLQIMWGMMAQDPWTYLLGMGYGLFQSGGDILPSAVSRELHFMSGSRSLLNSVWMQGGLIAVATFGLAMFWYVLCLRKRVLIVRRLGWYVALILGSMWLYNNAIFTRAFAGAVAFMIVWICHWSITVEDPDQRAGDIGGAGDRREDPDSPERSVMGVAHA